MGKKQCDGKASMDTHDASSLFNPSHTTFKLPQGSEMLKKHLAVSNCFHCASVTAGPLSIAARQAPSEVFDTLAWEKRNDPQSLLGSKISPPED